MHPQYLLGEEVLELVRLWSLWRPTGFGGHGPWPYPGGAMAQPALLVEAFFHCSRVAALAAREREVRDRRSSASIGADTQEQPP